VDRLGATLRDAIERARSRWQGLAPNHRLLVVTAAAILVLLFAGLAALYLRGPAYEPLFTNLTPADADRVVARLKDDKIPYRLSADGRTISVPEQDVAQERVAIAGAGLIQGEGVGFEIFDRTNFGMTRFQEQVDELRAIEGELERTIDGLDPVEASRVNIAMPGQQLYTSSQEPTTASIAIKLKPGMSLSADQVRGITLLAARAVPGLKPENVTIVDQNGNILLPQGGAIAQNGGAGQPNALQLTQEQLIAKERYESALQHSIQSMLDDTLGRGRAVARVSTEMDFDANATTSKLYAPQGTILSQQTERERYNGTQPAAQPPVGVPGTTSNIGTYQALQNPPMRGNYSKSKTTTNYDISEQDIKHVDAPGKVLRTSVAVLVNSSPLQLPNGQQGPPYQLTPANVVQIRNAVVAAAGLDLARGDQVSVEAIPFNPTVTAPPAAPVTTVLGIPLWALLVLGGVGAVVLIGLIAARSRRRFKPQVELPSFESLATELPPFEEHPIFEGAPAVAAPIRSAADLTREQMIEYVTTVAQENPESIAKLVKLWLAE